MSEWLGALWRKAGGWERIDVIAAGALASLYVILQLHAIVYDGFRAQDYFTHRTWVNQAFTEGWKFLVTYGENRSNPPFFHLFGSLLQRHNATSYMTELAFFNLLFSLAGLAAAFHLIQLIIADRLLRIAAFASFVFLPSFVIQSVAIAADSLTTGLFLLYLCAMIRLVRAETDKAFYTAAGLASVLLLIGVLTKFTFLSQVLGAAIFLAAAAFRKLLTPARAALAFAILVLPAALTGRWQMGLYQSQSKYNSGIVSGRGLQGALTAPLNPRSVLLPRPGDLELLNAPQYLTREGGQPILFRPNEHSYPGLLHMGAFTDMLNAYQFDPFHGYFGLRSPFAQSAMSLAVKTGLWLTLLAAAGLLILGASAARSLLPQAEFNPVLFLLVLSAFGWYANIAVFLPLVGNPYGGGYWHPRLVAPALVVFLILGFAWVQRFAVRWPVAPKVLLGLVLFQCAVHATFLWPSERDVSDFVESDRDLDRNREPFNVQYLTAQDKEGTAAAPFFWVGDSLGIVVRRHEPQVPVQGYILSMTLTAGPAEPNPARRVAIRLPDGTRQEIGFQGTHNLEVPVSLPQGRSLIALDVVEPRKQTAFIPGDGRNHMVHVAGIKWRYVATSKGSVPEPYLSVVNPQGATGTPDSFSYWLNEPMEISVDNRAANYPRARYELRFDASPGPAATDFQPIVTVSGAAADFPVSQPATIRVPLSLAPGANKFTVQLKNAAGRKGQLLSVRNIELVLTEGYEGQSTEPVKDAGPFPGKTTLKVVNAQGEDRGADQSAWYWVGPPAEIRIDKRTLPGVTEGYRLQFRLDAGPGDPNPHRVARLELPGGEEMDFDFVGTKMVDIPIKLQMGRQTFRVLPKSPEKNKVPVPNDPRTLVLRLAGVQLIEPGGKR